ncbi:MAG: RtcB family protein [Planctomycetota bacterium]
MPNFQMKRVSPFCVEIPRQGGMRVPGSVYASEALLETQKADEAVGQVANVAHMPGIVGASLAMPDFHWGYGFPIGGVAAFDADEGVISPGGVGYDINCGVRLHATSLVESDVKSRLGNLAHALFAAVPTGVGSEGAIPEPSRKDLEDLLARGARWAVEKGYGRPEDLDSIEDGGTYKGADPGAVSSRAIHRGVPQIGTLGSGNHFLELDVVDEIFLPEAAEKMGLKKGGIAVSIHTGSRGLGYQVCEDSLHAMQKAVRTYGIELPDRQLACAPLSSPEGKAYLAAMAAAANFAWVNRQVIAALAGRALAQSLGISEDRLGMRLVWDVCHNIAKFEEHEVEGRVRRLCVHRKGATRAFGPHHPLLPAAWRELGQPVLIPGDMGRCSYVLLGTEGAMRHTFGSTCHGAGRVCSRTAILKALHGENPIEVMDRRYGVFVLAKGRDSAAEEMPDAYKDVSQVVGVCEAAGLSRKVAKLRPLACVKG